MAGRIVDETLATATGATPLPLHSNHQSPTHPPHQSYSGPRDRLAQARSVRPTANSPNRIADPAPGRMPLRSPYSSRGFTEIRTSSHGVRVGGDPATPSRAWDALRGL